MEAHDARRRCGASAPKAIVADYEAQMKESAEAAAIMTGSGVGVMRT